MSGQNMYINMCTLFRQHTAACGKAIKRSVRPASHAMSLFCFAFEFDSARLFIHRKQPFGKAWRVRSSLIHQTTRSWSDNKFGPIINNILTYSPYIYREQKWDLPKNETQIHKDVCICDSIRSDAIKRYAIHFRQSAIKSLILFRGDFFRCGKVMRYELPK